MKHTKKNLNNLIYGLDIETTTIVIDSKNKGSFMYSFCVCNLDILSGNYNKCQLGRTYEDLDSYLYKLNREAKLLDTNYIVYVHNLSYEYSFFSNNLEFFKEHNEVGGKNHLYMEQNKPLYVKCDRLEFRCSYLLLSQSIKAIGESINLPKLDFNYTKVRTPLTPLEDKEIEYNYRDVEIMLRGVYKLVNSNAYIKCANDIPYTKTGVMRHNCEQNPEVNVKREYVNRNGVKKKGSSSRLNKYLCGLEKATSLEQLNYWEQLFQGGLVYSNPKYVGDVLYNVASFDFSSDYPYQMLVRYYPSQFKEYKEDDKIRKLNQCMYKSSEKNYIHSKPFRNMFNATIILRQIKAKYDFQPIGTSKIIELDEKLHNMKNCTIINGKIIEIIPAVKMAVTCIDMLTLKLFYDYELVAVEYLEIATRYSKSNEFKLNSVEYNAKAKVEYKVYDELIREKGQYHQYTADEIADVHYRNTVNKEKDYLSQIETSHSLYQAVKSDLNALYGDNAQHLLHDRISYDHTTREWIKESETYEDYIKAQHKTSYIYGLYVPQYARASILYIAYKFITNGLPVYYIDTDSIKTIDCKKAHELVAEYNEIQLRLLGKYKYLKFGVLEHEYTAVKFSSLGTKSYIKLSKNKKNETVLTATISGLPHATKLFNELLDYYGGNYDELVESVYHYGTIFDRSITNKLASTYNFINFDVNIEGYSDNLVSGVVLNPTDVTMRDFTSKTWYIYARLICRLYKKDFTKFAYKTTISRDTNGNIKVMHI